MKQNTAHHDLDTATSLCAPFLVVLLTVSANPSEHHEYLRNEKQTLFLLPRGDGVKLPCEAAGGI